QNRYEAPGLDRPHPDRPPPGLGRTRCRRHGQGLPCADPGPTPCRGEGRPPGTRGESDLPCPFRSRGSGRADGSRSVHPSRVRCRPRRRNTVDGHRVRPRPHPHGSRDHQRPLPRGVTSSPHAGARTCPAGTSRCVTHTPGSGALQRPALTSAAPGAAPPWGATEYAPGPSLTEAVITNGPFPEGSLRVHTLGLARALQAIHGAGLIHRDLKPSNVLLSPRGPQVIDFGIARAIGGTVLTKTGEAFGTPSYTAPETILGRPQTPESDIFSLAGVVIYASRGMPPFGQGPAADVLHRIVD